MKIYFEIITGGKMEALVLVGHGSRLPYSKELLEKLAEKIKEKNVFEIVEIGLMEFNEPTIPQAVKKAIERGAKKIIVVPVFLAHGVHTLRDIPHMLGLEEKVEIEDNNGHHHHHEHEHLELPDGVEIIYRDPIGADDRLVDIILDRAFGK